MTGAPARPLRVAFLITSSGMGGAEREVACLAEAFHCRGWDVAAVSMLPLEAPLSGLAASGIHTESLGMRRGTPDPRAVLRLRRFVRRWRPDVMHAHMVHANLLARLARLVVGVPVIVSTMHNQDEGAQWRYIAYRLTDRLSDVTTTVSHVALAEAVRRGAVPRRRIRLVPNGIEIVGRERNAHVRARTRLALGLTDEFAWLAAGRFVEAKAYPDMVAAFQMVASDRPSARLLIAGTGPLAGAIEAQIREAGLDHLVDLLGLRPDVPDLMQAADAFVMSSAWEGLPMVLLEAGASSLPVVATDVGGSRDAILDGASGRLCRPHDPVGLARAMKAVMALSQADLAAMGEAGRGHIARTFEIGRIAELWEEIYLGARRGRLAEGRPT